MAIQLAPKDDKSWLFNGTEKARGPYDVRKRGDFVDIYFVGQDKSLSGLLSYTEFEDQGGNPYASSDALISDLSSFFF